MALFVFISLCSLVWVSIHLFQQEQHQRDFQVLLHLSNEKTVFAPQRFSFIISYMPHTKCITSNHIINRQIVLSYLLWKNLRTTFFWQSFHCSLVVCWQWFSRSGVSLDQWPKTSSIGRKMCSHIHRVIHSWPLHIWIFAHFWCWFFSSSLDSHYLLSDGLLVGCLYLTSFVHTRKTAISTCCFDYVSLSFSLCWSIVLAVNALTTSFFLNVNFDNRCQCRHLSIFVRRILIRFPCWFI